MGLMKAKTLPPPSERSTAFTARSVRSAAVSAAGGCREEGLCNPLALFAL